MSRLLAELMTGTRPVYENENEGAGGAGDSTQAAGAGNDTTAAGAGNDTQAGAQGADSQPAGAAAAAQPSREARRIGQLTARNAELARKLAEATAPRPATAPKLDATADFEARVAAQAAAQAESLVAIRSFNERCNAEVDKGKSQFGAGEFNASVDGLKTLVDPTDPASVANYQDFIESTLETGAGAALLFELGKDLDEAERIFALPSKRRAIELARKADVVAKPAEPSGAPKPLRPIEPHGGRHEAIKASDAERSDSLSTAEWMARRKAEVAAQPQR